MDPAPGERDITSDFKSILEFNWRTMNSKDLQIRFVSIFMG
jgi:hypothetical protein